MMQYQPILFNEQANDPLKDVIVFDLETTGFSPREDEIIQIAATKLVSGQLNRKGTFFTYVKPRRTIPLEITDLTGISHADVKKAPPIKDALAAFSDFCGDATLVAHNGHTFDFPFLRNACQRVGCRTRQVFYFDTLHLSKHIWPRRGARHSLDVIIERCKVSMRGVRRHDGRGDVSLLARCIQRMLGHMAHDKHECQVKLYEGILPYLNRT
jgi:DNA polymerase III subunit epsilon